MHIDHQPGYDHFTYHHHISPHVLNNFKIIADSLKNFTLYSCTLKEFYFSVRNSSTLVFLNSWWKTHPKKVSLILAQLGCGTSSSLLSFHRSNKVLATFFSLYAMNSTLSTSATCIILKPSSVPQWNYLDPQWCLNREFILKNSRIFKVSACSCLDPLCYPTWLVTTRLNIFIVSQNSALVTSPWNCTLGASGNFCSSTFLLNGRPLSFLWRGLVSKKMHKYKLERNF